MKPYSHCTLFCVLSMYVLLSLCLQASAFSTDKVNRMGFSKFFQEKSDGMWARGKEMMKYVLKRGGRMGTGFQLPPFGVRDDK